MLEFSSVTTDAVKLRTVRWEWALALLISVACGFMALSSGDAPMRWFVVFLAGTFALPVALLLHDAHRLQLTVMILSLQAYMCLTFGADGGSGSAGRGVELHMTTLLCLIAMATRWREIAARGFRYAGPMFGPFLAVTATLVFSTLANRELKAGVITILAQLQYYFVYVTVLNVITNKRYALIAVAAILLTSVTQTLVYFVENITHKTFTLMGEVVDHSGDLLQRHGGLISTHPSGFAEWMNLIALLSVALYLGSPNAIWRRRAAIAAVLGTTSVLLTLTRAAWIGYVLGAVVMVLIGVRRGWLSSSAVAGMVAAGLVMVVLFREPIAGVFMKQHDSDFDERYVLQKMALMVIEARPFLGVGAGAYAMEFKNYAVDRSFNGYWVFTVHNHYMLRTAENGFQGLLAFMWLMWRGWRLAWSAMRLKSPVAARFGLGIIAGLVALLFQFYFDIGDNCCVWLTLWFLFGMLEAFHTLEREGVVVDFDDEPASA